MVETKTNRRSSRSSKPRTLYTAGSEADGNWVEESPIPSSIEEQQDEYDQGIGALLHQQGNDDDSDATVLMTEEIELDTYTKEVAKIDCKTANMNKDSAQSNYYSESYDDNEDIKVNMKEDDMYTRSDEGEENASHVIQGFGICDTVRMEHKKGIVLILSCLKLIQICVLLW